MVRHPDGIGADCHAPLRIFGCHNAFDRELSVPGFPQPARIVPGHGAIELGVDEANQAAVDLHVHEVRGPDFGRGHQVPEIARRGERLRCGAPGYLRRNREVVGAVSLAIAADGHIDRQQYRAEPGRLRAPQHLFHECAITPDINLEPFGPWICRGDVFNRGRRQSRARVRHAGSVRGSRHRQLAAARMKKPRGGCGADKEGRG